MLLKILIEQVFHQDHYAEFEKLLEFQVKNGADAIIVCGTTGESSTMTDSERKETIIKLSPQSAAISATWDKFPEASFIATIFWIYPIPVKAALNLMGYDFGTPRLPLTPISPTNLEMLKIAMKPYLI